MGGGYYAHPLAPLTRSPDDVKPLTPAQVARKLKARGLKATPDEIEQLTRMMNEDREREAALERQSKAVDKFMAQFTPRKRKR